jgi:hypothetical protein
LANERVSGKWRIVLDTSTVPLSPVSGSGVP